MPITRPRPNDAHVTGHGLWPDVTGPYRKGETPADMGIPWTGPMPDVLVFLSRPDYVSTIAVFEGRLMRLSCSFHGPDGLREYTWYNSKPPIGKVWTLEPDGPARGQAIVTLP